MRIRDYPGIRRYRRDTWIGRGLVAVGVLLWLAGVWYRFGHGVCP